MRADAPYRIAYVIGELGKGGAEYQLHELLRHLDRALFAPHVIALAAGGWWVEHIRGLGVPVTELPRRGSAELSRVLALRAALQRLAPHVLHTGLWSGNVYGRLAAVGLGIPVRIAAERNVIARPWWQVLIERALDRGTDVYLVNCEAVADMLMRQHIPRVKVRVIPNGIDLGRLSPFVLERRAARVAAGFDPGRRLVAQVGRLAPQKDHPTFLRAAAMVAQELPDVDFLLVGAGEERVALEGLARELGLGTRLHLTGLRDDVPSLLAGVDVLTSSSLFEGFPNVLLEAMATGAVAVATDVGGCRELVVAEETGLLIPPRSPTALAAAVLRLLRDSALAQRLALAARRRVEAEFAVELMAGRTAATYMELLRTVGRGPAAVAAA